MSSSQERLWQKRPFAFGCLVLLGLFILFILFLSLFARKSIREPEAGISFSFKDQVAVIKIEGVIAESENILRQLRRYKKSRSVKAVVLRVNSPGGAVAPAQEIYQELKRFGEKKPVVCSMSSGKEASEEKRMSPRSVNCVLFDRSIPFSVQKFIDPL